MARRKWLSFLLLDCSHSDDFAGVENRPVVWIPGMVFGRMGNLRIAGGHLGIDRSPFVGSEIIWCGTGTREN